MSLHAAPTLDSLFATPAALPVVPKVVQQLIESFQHDAVSIDEIASQLAADPVLSAKTLRLANSAYFHVSRHISTVDDALRMLGFVMVRNLVLGCGVAGAFKGVRELDLPLFWRHSLDTACAARWLASAADLNADLAFTVGLMHGGGALLLHAVAPETVRPLNLRCHPLEADRAGVELEALGFHHGHAGAELALRWRFPAAVHDALRAVPDPLNSPEAPRLAALVHLAAWRARVAALRWPPERAAATCPERVGRLLGLHLSWLPEPGTLGGTEPAMPPLAELSQGMEAMFH